MMAARCSESPLDNEERKLRAPSSEVGVGGGEGGWGGAGEGVPPYHSSSTSLLKTSPHLWGTCETRGMRRERMGGGVVGMWWGWGCGGVGGGATSARVQGDQVHVFLL